MPCTLQTLTKKIEKVPNTVNCNIVKEFYTYLMERDLSKNHKINNLKVIISYANYLGSEITFHKICNKDQILSFLNTKKKDAEKDLKESGSLLGITI